MQIKIQSFVKSRQTL